MRHFKEWIQTIELMSGVLELEPKNEQAKDIRNMAGRALIADGYPVNDNERELTVGIYTFTVSDAVAKTSNGEETTGYETAIADLTSQNRILRQKLSAILSIAKTADRQDKPAQKKIDDIAPDPRTEMEELPEICEEVQTAQGRAPAGHEDVAKNVAAHVPEIIIHMDDAETEVLNPGPAAERQNAAPKANAEGPQNAAAITNTEGAGRAVKAGAGYSDHVGKQDIVFSYHQVTIRRENDSVATKVEIVASPLSMEEGESQIIAWASNGIRRETKVSQGGRKRRTYGAEHARHVLYGRAGRTERRKDRC